MIVVLVADPNGGLNMMAEGGDGTQIMAVLQAAMNSIKQQMTAPRLLLPNGGAHVVPPAAAG